MVRLIPLAYFTKVATGFSCVDHHLITKRFIRGTNVSMESTNYEKNVFFRHSDKQTHEPVTGKVSGQIPTWLEGTLIRNGSGIFQVGEDKYKHLFDGLSVLHRFHIKDGEATYQNRALESDTYKANMDAQRIVVSEFGTKAYKDPCHTLFNRLKTSFVGLLSKSGQEEMTDNCSVNVAYYGDQLYAMTEGVFIHRLDPENLKSIAKTKIQDYVSLNTATAHPHVLQDGTVLNIGMNYRHKKGPTYCIVKIPPSFDCADESSYKNAKIIAEIPSRWKFNPCYYHSFGMTTDKIIFIESPLVTSIPKLITSDITMKTFRDCMQWYPSEKTKIHVVSMEDGKIHPVVYETDGLFTFHHINAYEENGHIILDVAGYNSGEVVTQFMAEQMNEPGLWIKNASARRFVLPLNVTGKEKPGENLVEIADATATASLSSKSKSGAVVVDLIPRHLSKEWFELPRINYKYNGKNYKFMYGVTSDDPGQKCIDEPNVITKIDVSTGTQTSWVKKDIMASEPIFVANPTVENPSEDDGVVLSALLHKEDVQAVTLLILDAKNMTEVASVKFRAEGPVTATFHGMWSHQGERVHTY